MDSVGLVALRLGVQDGVSLVLLGCVSGLLLGVLGQWVLRMLGAKRMSVCGKRNLDTGRMTSWAVSSFISMSTSDAPLSAGAAADAS